MSKTQKEVQQEKDLILEMIDNGDISVEGLLSWAIDLCDARREKYKFEWPSNLVAQVFYSDKAVALTALMTYEKVEVR